MSSNKPLDKVHQLASELPESIAHAHELYRALERQSTKLKEEGLIHATAHWRKGRYLCLIYPSRMGEQRVVKYVGRDPKKIRASQAAMHRAVEYDALIARMALLESIAEQCNLQLVDVTRKLLDFEAFKPMFHGRNDMGLGCGPKK